ncbi:HD domain-containing protein [Dokdonia sinensis]|uniref:HD domain-containing protein n=1 Tax=Dokdonia sinensis TaxID=2479847 RepID=A0A3M0FXI9_9FLAO|nr:HD domain-containing protein [Dokdonia sinensis]RMB57460.1 HD domain-containing protein [Dokdonia sinensis]
MQPHKTTIINDPIYGFITIPNGVIFNLIQHPYFQRLRRISQMGLSYLVYPGAHHTRFHHAVGCLHIMQKALETLRNKGVAISNEEEEATLIAILLHDIGHGPFSHAMEHSIVDGVHHELISLYFMEALNAEFNGSLTLAIKIFKGSYERAFLNQLVSGQLDMDRTDYLKRDSFYTGMAEGNINTERIIAMLCVKDDNLVVSPKGIYTVEKFLVARRLMYWTVYLHKTSLVAEQLITRVLKRAKELSHKGISLPASSALLYFLKNKITKGNFTPEILETFSKLDDYDIISAMKEWCEHDDFVLRELSKCIINRDLPKVKIRKKAFAKAKLDKQKAALVERFGISEYEASYFVFTGTISNQAYNYTHGGINILTDNYKVVDIVKASDQLSLKSLTKAVVKNYICYPKPKG